MKKSLWIAAAVALSFERAVAIMPEVVGFRAPAETPREVARGFLWMEAEGFSDYGNWRLDTQFVHKMGSGYLLAAGVLKPLGKATTKLTIPSAGTWTVWVRTKDWLPEYHPGTFRVLVGGQPGATLGRSGKEGWRWERAGAWSLPQALTLEFERPASVGEVRLTFDSDLTPLHPAPHPKTLVKAYRLEGRCGGQWKRLADVTDNLLRLRVHAFSPQELQAIRVTVLKTWGDASARIFEVRTYASVE